ncbi:MAG: nucleoside 2-deoxyribosyltransferase [Candidatus Andersenbacteria bacterium]|nr:nucleoside 2-deoxyribosyltransferase [Candidatus Andersenbacteria bacterium]MBI3250483.1 nucleoside 2-deoxyribosyltransferase [Candidatus Andersenbacteria bacterium]
MKIYFAGSIRGGRQDQALYFEIIKQLEKFGTVLTEHVGNVKVVETETARKDTDIFARDVNWLTQSDAVVAEVTSPSLGVGYEIAMAESLGKKIICIFRPANDRHLSAMIAGNPRLQVSEYTDLVDLDKIFSDFFYLRNR